MFVSRSLVLLTGARRLLLGVCLLVGLGPRLRAEGALASLHEVVAITNVGGTGQRLCAVGLQFAHEIDSESLAVDSFQVKGLKVLHAYVSRRLEPGEPADQGAYVILEVDAEDPAAALYVSRGRSAERRAARVEVTQVKDVKTTTGQTLSASPVVQASTRVRNLVVEDFQQLDFKDPATGDTLHYNLYVPKHYDPTRRYPLVLFMHDAGATSTVTDTTLVQGLGAVIWASPSEQSKHEAFVLAPQYSTQVVNDQSEATSALETTLDLIRSLSTHYSIDTNRLYTTGQSGGAMMSLAMGIKHPDLFAAMFIVAGQWDAAKVKPLAKTKLWIVVSEGDLKAFPGENAITSVLEAEGARVARAFWDGRCNVAQFNTLACNLEAAQASVNYVVLRKGTVVPAGQSDNGGSNHVNTWRIAYTMAEVRDWLFLQHK